MTWNIHSSSGSPGLKLDDIVFGKPGSRLTTTEMEL